MRNEQRAAPGGRLRIQVEPGPTPFGCQAGHEIFPGGQVDHRHPDQQLTSAGVVERLEAYLGEAASFRFGRVAKTLPHIRVLEPDLAKPAIWQDPIWSSEAA